MTPDGAGEVRTEAQAGLKGLQHFPSVNFMVGLIQPAVKILSQGLFDLILQATDRFDGGLIGRHLGGVSRSVQ